MRLKLAHLYPDTMNLYGDRGNVLALKRRCEWRGIDLDVRAVGLGDPLDGGFDIVFMAGGQDRDQQMVCRELTAAKGERLRAMADEGVVMLAICGGYQLFGRRYVAVDGSELPGAGVIDLETIAGGRRMIGNVVVGAPVGEAELSLVGFENHAGKTFLGAGVRPLGRIVYGFGNNGEDGDEGAVVNNVYGTYLHGPFLPKNPVFADLLIRKAIDRKYGATGLAPLDDDLELAANAAATARTRALRRSWLVPWWVRR